MKTSSKSAEQLSYKLQRTVNNQENTLVPARNTLQACLNQIKSSNQVWTKSQDLANKELLSLTKLRKKNGSSDAEYKAVKAAYSASDAYAKSTDSLSKTFES
jgi:hypothetical protein